MEDFKKFFKGLDDSPKEIFISIVNDISDEGSKLNLDKLNEDLKRIKNEINLVNQSRNFISEKIKRYESMLDSIKKYLNDNKEDTNYSIFLLKNLIEELIKKMKEQNLKKKPIDLLNKKFKLKEVIKNREETNNIVTNLLKQIKENS